jgi:hypothetical protein
MVKDKAYRAEIASILNTIADKVLRYRPKPKSKPARRRKRQRAKLASK